MTSRRWISPSIEKGITDDLAQRWHSPDIIRAITDGDGQRWMAPDLKAEIKENALPPAAVLSGPTATQTGSSTANLAVTSDTAGGTIYFIVTTNSSTPTAAQIIAGHDSTGSAAAFASTIASPVVGSNASSATSLAASTTYYAMFVQSTAGGNSNVSISSSTTTTVAPAVLSAPTGTQTGATTATLSSTTDQASGTLYAIVTTNSGTPTAAQIIAGTDSTGSAAAYSSSTTPSSGANSFSATGLTGSTVYYAMFVQTDAGGNSNVSISSSFTTAVPTTTLDPAHIAASATLSNGNLSYTATDTANCAESIASHSTGKYYMSCLITAIGAEVWVGLIDTASFSTTDQTTTLQNNGYVYEAVAGACRHSNAGMGLNCPTATTNGVIDMAVDIDAKKVWWRINNGTWNGDAAAHPETGTGAGSIINAATFKVGVYCATNAHITLNFGASTYTNAAPTGYGNW